MTRRLISSGSTFERDIGYSRAVVDGEWIFVSGTTGFDVLCQPHRAAREDRDRGDGAPRAGFSGLMSAT